MELFDALQPDHIQFIEKQAVFFVGTAGAEGKVNVSPKGMDSLRVVDGQCLYWLNYTGSGNETAAHVLENQRMTLMFCSFAKQPLILRIYGKARFIQETDPEWRELLKLFPESHGARQVFDLTINLVQTSCGYAVPHMELLGERETLHKYHSKKTADELRDYQRQKNAKSLDGMETGLKTMG